MEETFANYLRLDAVQKEMPCSSGYQPSQSIDSALLTGSRNGHRKCLELLIRGGADVNAAIEGTTPLIESAKCVHAMCMKTLLAKGADVNATDAGGGTALSYAVKDSECMELLIEAGANVNLPGSGGNIPLHNACSHGYIKSIEMLLRTGADVNPIDAAEFTPLKCAAKYGHNNCIKRLIEAGAHVNATDNGSVSLDPISLVIPTKYVNATTSCRSTALMIATRYAKHKCVETLIQAGADVNITDSYGYTALFKLENTYSTYSVHCLQTLFIAGAHVNMINRMGQNALRYYLAETTYLNSAVVLLLFAAGETLAGGGYSIERFGENRKVIGQFADVPAYLLEFTFTRGTDLRHMCREAIRNHLKRLDDHENLIGRVRQLGLPMSLARYVLYDALV